MNGFYAGLAAAALATTEARLQREEAERQAAAQVEQFDNLAKSLREADQRNVIDVEAREVPDVQALPAPATAMRRVSKEEFARFVSTYPHALDRDIARMCEPPVVSFNDFTRGNWPESVVASHTFEAPGSMVPTGWKIRSTK